MISKFNALGLPTTTAPTTSTTTTAPSVAPSQVNVQVLNASTVSGLAGTTSSDLTPLGFNVTAVADAPSEIPSGSPSQIEYGPSGLDAAHALGAVLSGGSLSYVSDPSLTGNNLVLLLAGTQFTVTGSSTTTSSSTTTTTPSTSTTPTTIPSDVYTNTQPEPWNPYPCTLGASTQAAGN